MHHRNRIATVLLATTALFCGSAADAKKKEKPPQVSVGRTPMPALAPTETIAEALPGLAAHTTLARLIQASQVAPTLAGPGPITVFAPSDDAFARLAPGTVDTLLKPENAASLTAILNTHLVAGAIDVEQIKAMIAAGNGTATLPTLSGQPLSATLENGVVLLTDPNGGKSYVSQPDLKEANGIVHVTNGVSVPKLG